MKARDLIKWLEKDGWYQVRQNGSYRIFKHPIKKNTMPIPDHGRSDLRTGTLKSILKQAGLK